MHIHNKCGMSAQQQLIEKTLASVPHLTNGNIKMTVGKKDVYISVANKVAKPKPIVLDDQDLLCMHNN